MVYRVFRSRRRDGMTGMVGEEPSLVAKGRGAWREEVQRIGELSGRTLPAVFLLPKELELLTQGGKNSGHRRGSGRMDWEFWRRK